MPCYSRQRGFLKTEAAMAPDLKEVMVGMPQGAGAKRLGVDVLLS